MKPVGLSQVGGQLNSLSERVSTVHISAPLRDAAEAVRSSDIGPATDRLAARLGVSRAGLIVGVDGMGDAAAASARNYRQSDGYATSALGAIAAGLGPLPPQTGMPW